MKFFVTAMLLICFSLLSGCVMNPNDGIYEDYSDDRVILSQSGTELARVWVDIYGGVDFPRVVVNFETFVLLEVSEFSLSLPTCYLPLTETFLTKGKHFPDHYVYETRWERVSTCTHANINLTYQFSDRGDGAKSWIIFRDVLL